MLQDFRKIVGIKTNEELEARHYEQELRESPGAVAAQYFELGGMHRKTGDTEAAITAFLNAATLAVSGEDLTIAMAANKAIIQLEPDHKDALANLAYIRFQYGTEVVNKEYEELLRELEERRYYAQHTQLDNLGEKNVPSQPVQSGDHDPAFDVERQALADSTNDRRNEGEDLALEASWQIDKLAEPSPSARQSGPGANDILTSPSNQRHGEKTPTSQKPKTRLWGEARKTDTRHPQSQQNTRAFEANRKSLVDLIEGGNTTEYSTAFELERQTLVDLIGQSDDTEDTLKRTSDTSIHFGTQSSKSARTSDNEADTRLKKSTRPKSDALLADTEIEPDEIIDLRSEAEQQSEIIRVHLRRCVVFSPLSDQELRELAESVRLHACPEGATILDKHEATRSLFVVFAGEVELAIHAAVEGEELSVLTLVQGDFFGEHTFWKQNTMAVAATTDTACTLGEIPVAIFLKFARKYPVMLQFIKRVCKRRYFAAMLAQTPVFQECGTKERQIVAEYLSPVHVSRGVPILPEGDLAGDLYIIQSGDVNVFTTLTENGDSPILLETQEQIALDKLHEGDVFGEESFFTNEPCFATFWAQTDVLLLKLSSTCLTTFAEQFPGFRRHLYAIHQRRSKTTMQAIQSMLAGQR